MLAIQLVKDIKMPANWGEMSKWFTLNPELVPPFKPTPIVSRVTVNHLSQPVNAATNSATAGPNCPKTLNNVEDLLWELQKNFCVMCVIYKINFILGHVLPMLFRIFLTAVGVKYGLVNIQSATWLTIIENNHIAR